MANTSKQVKQTNTTKQASTGLANVAAQVVAAVTTATAPQPTKKPAIAYIDGINPLAPANSPAVVIAGQAWQGTLPATNPANRAAVGTVSAKVPGTLTLGNGKGPRTGQNVAYFAAITEALANGPQTANALANAAGAGGAAFVAYAVRNGWLTASK